MNIFIASDHGGFELKERLLKELDYDITDMGPYEFNEDDDYPDYAFPLAESVANTKDALGILICRSGNGVAIAANKVDGSYAALCFSTKHALKAREDDNANICCLDADYEGDDPIEIVRTFIETRFAGIDTRHGRRWGKIVEYEKSH